MLQEILSKVEEIQNSNADLNALRPNNLHSQELYYACIKKVGLPYTCSDSRYGDCSDVKAAIMMLEYLPPQQVAATIARHSPEINVLCRQAEKNSKAKEIVH